MDMVEKVARAMAENAGFAWEYCAQSQWKSDARAGIAAMREPTEAMIEASNREWDGRMSHRSSGAWQAMIGAALLGE
jgi:hypothetical protein